jgi:multiple sugar transport system substrate-binding protein
MKARQLLISAATLAVAFAPAGPVLAQDKPDALTIISHRVHQTVATGEQGGDITKAWQDENGVGIEWVTLDTGALHERLFRELQLPETTIDIAFLLNTNAVQGLTTRLEPLDQYQEADPIEDFDDFFPGLVDAMTFDGQLYGVPFRHASTCFHYNERILAEKGIEPPQTMEELIDAARALTFERDDGTRVHGFLINGQGYANTVDLARAWNGDFITLDYKVATTDEGMMKAVQLLRDFYEEGVMPSNWTAIPDEEVNTWIQSGRAAMTTTSCGRNRIYNDPEKSQEAGNIKTVALPVSAEFQGQFDVAPAKVEFWTMVIPANSQHKELAWDLIRTMASKESTLMAALNGNGPVRASTYDAPEMKDQLEYGDSERAVLLVGRVPLPPFDDAAKASDIFMEELQAAVLGMKPVEEAMQAVEDRVTPLLPAN